MFDTLSPSNFWDIYQGLKTERYSQVLIKTINKVMFSLGMTGLGVKFASLIAFTMSWQLIILYLILSFILLAAFNGFLESNYLMANFTMYVFAFLQGVFLYPFLQSIMLTVGFAPIIAAIFQTIVITTVISIGSVLLFNNGISVDWFELSQTLLWLTLGLIACQMFLPLYYNFQFVLTLNHLIGVALFSFWLVIDVTRMCSLASFNHLDIEFIVLVSALSIYQDVINIFVDIVALLQTEAVDVDFQFKSPTLIYGLIMSIGVLAFLFYEKLQNVFSTCFCLKDCSIKSLGSESFNNSYNNKSIPGINENHDDRLNLETKFKR